MKTLKDITSISDSQKQDIRRTVKECIRYLQSQEHILPSDPEFDFDNQLDDFINDDGEYVQVVEFIKWFFNMRR